MVMFSVFILCFEIVFRAIGTILKNCYDKNLVDWSHGKSLVVINIDCGPSCHFTSTLDLVFSFVLRNVLDSQHPLRCTGDALIFVTQLVI